MSRGGRRLAARLEGRVVGTRTTPREYTAAVVAVRPSGKASVHSWHQSEELAVAEVGRLKRQRAKTRRVLEEGPSWLTAEDRASFERLLECSIVMTGDVREDR